MLAPLRVEREQLGRGRGASEVLRDAADLVVGERDAERAAERDGVVVRGRHHARWTPCGSGGGGALRRASAARTSLRAFACSRSTRPNTTVSSSANALAHFSASS